MTRIVRNPRLRPEGAPFHWLRQLRCARRAVVVRGKRVLDLLAKTRPTQVLQAVIGRVVVDVVHGVLVVLFGEGKGDRHESVDEEMLAVNLASNVAIFTGFGGGDHAHGRFEAAEGGDLWFGGSFGSFDHVWMLPQKSTLSLCSECHRDSDDDVRTGSTRPENAFDF